MILTVSALPSAADTQGSQSPNVTVPLFSIAPRVPSGSKLADIVALSVNQASSVTRCNPVVPDFAGDRDQEVAGHGPTRRGAHSVAWQPAGHDKVLPRGSTLSAQADLEA